MNELRAVDPILFVCSSHRTPIDVIARVFSLTPAQAQGAVEASSGHDGERRMQLENLDHEGFTLLQVEGRVMTAAVLSMETQERFGGIRFIVIGEPQGRR